MKISRATKVELVGRGTVNLSPADHVATGGEGSVYRRGDTIIKLYTDPAKMLRDGMTDKIRLLSALQHPYVVTPCGVVLDAKAEPIGYYMQYADGEPMARVFTNDFRIRSGFDDRQAVTLAARMLEVVEFAHGHQAVMADANELNWLMVDGPEPRVIDVDSWQVGRWPAKAIMPSIRDWRSKGFCEASDYFAWGVVSFQVFTGIHPYKGTLSGYKPSELERRMKDGASVFATGVRLNRAVRDFGCIPANLLGWYEAAFQHGDRSKPPVPVYGASVPARAIRTARISVSPQGTLHYDRLYDGSDVAVRIFPCGVVQLRSGALWDLAKGRVIGTGGADCEVIRTDDGWLIADVVGTNIRARFVNAVSLIATDLSVVAEVERIFRADGRLFAITAAGISELSLRVFARPILSLGQTWGAQTRSTVWFDGVGVQDSMGAIFLIAPFSGNACAQVRVPELDGFHVVAARAGNRFVALVGLNKAGEYHKLQLTFDRRYTTYSVRDSLADSAELNMAILPTSVVATIVNDGELVVFVPTNGAVKKITDKDIATDMSLGTNGDKVVYLRSGQVWSVRM